MKMSIEWKEAFKSKGLKLNLVKTEVMDSGGITKDGLSRCKVDPCGFCCLRVKLNSVLHIQCGMRIHVKCA